MGASRTQRYKTEAERQEYLNQVKGGPSPTLEQTIVTMDSTATISAVEPEKSLPFQLTKEESPAKRWLRDHALGVLITVILIPVLAGLLLQVYSLNREVGVLKEQIDAARQREERTEKEMEKMEERLNKEIDKTNDRLERINDRPQTPPR
jgi:hypothetical protein